MECKSKLGPTLHVRTCRVTVPDLKNGWADCVQIWYTDRERLVGCRESQLETHPRSSARAGLSLSLARLSSQKVSYWCMLSMSMHSHTSFLSCYQVILSLMRVIFLIVAFMHYEVYNKAFRVLIL